MHQTKFSPVSFIYLNALEELLKRNIRPTSWNVFRHDKVQREMKNLTEADSAWLYGRTSNGLHWCKVGDASKFMFWYN